MSGIKNPDAESTASCSASSLERFEELIELKNFIGRHDVGVSFLEKVAAVQRLRTKAALLRGSLSEDSTNPTICDVAALINFASEAVQELKKEGLNQSASKQKPGSVIEQNARETLSGFTNQGSVPTRISDRTKLADPAGILNNSCRNDQTGTRSSSNCFEDLRKGVAKSASVDTVNFAGGETRKAASSGDNTNKCSQGNLFERKVGVWTCRICDLRNNEPGSLNCAACHSPKDLGSNSGSPSSISSLNGSAPPIRAFTFGSPVRPGLNSDTLLSVSNGSAFIPAPSLNVFSFQLKSPAKGSDEIEEEAGGDEEDVEAEQPHGPLFEPVVQLPKLVSIKTGEENEVELYSQRAKLYRYVGGEWKERGIGDLKLMKERNGRKIRMLMRREKVLKVCCNQHIHKNLELFPMPSTKNAWVWNGIDYSDDSPDKKIEECGKYERLALRFKHESYADEFCDLIERCKQIVDGDNTEPSVDRFERISEPPEPIAESRIEAMNKVDVNNPFGSPGSAPRARKSYFDAHNPPSSGDIEIERRQIIYGDEIYRHFGVIYGGKEAQAVYVPSVGFLKLRNSRDVKQLIVADLKSEREFLDLVGGVAEKMNTTETNRLPLAVRVYGKAIKIKESGEIFQQRFLVGG